jgi:transposase
MKISLLPKNQLPEDVAPWTRARPVPSAKYVVTLSEEERTRLETLLHTGRRAARTLTHAWILLKADASEGGPAWTDEQIRATFDVSLATINRVRRAFVEEGVEAALHRRASDRSHLRKIDGASEAHLIALACSEPPAGQAHWTLRLLADRFVTLEGSAVSYETVRRTLKKTSSSRGC